MAESSVTESSMTESSMGASYHIQSKNTLFYVISTPQDKVGQEVVTTPSMPPRVVRLTLNPPIQGPVTLNIHIQGVSGLYVSLKDDKENTKLTWAKEPYPWTISIIAPQAYVVTPGSGKDLYWVDDSGAPDHIEVRPGKHIKPPQNEWIFTPLPR